jgi:DNA-binding LacI/PurR family transcriptional regulator
MVQTIADIAKLAGVSKSTVSRALNDNPLISAKTRAKIQTIAREHRFSAHMGARCLSKGRSRIIALVTPLTDSREHYINDPYVIELLKGITMTVGDYGYDLLLFQPRGDLDGEIRRYIESKRADGVIMMGCWGFEAMAGFEGQAPVIICGSNASDSVCSVDCDNITGGRLATEHLLSLGRRRIAFLGGQEQAKEVQMRFKGYQDALERSGFETDAALIDFGDYASQSGNRMMGGMLEKNPDIDAVFACSDLMAIGAMEAVRKSGRRVGRDVAVVGFDDIPMAAYCSPPLTTIAQDIIKIGEILVHNLMRYLEDGVISKAILPVRLVVRESAS